MSDDEDKKQSKASKAREYARQQRRKAYQAAKEKRKTDPKFIEMKEKQKEMRRAAYQKQKAYVDQKKNAAKEAKKAEKKAKMELTFKNLPIEKSIEEEIHLVEETSKAEKINLLKAKLRLIEGGKAE